MLRRLMGEFKRLFNIQQAIPDKSDDLRSAFPNWLHMAAAKGRIVLVLDALNQLEDCDGAPDLVWLPPVMPQNLRLIVSTLPGRPLAEIKKRGWPTEKTEPLSADERRKLINRWLRDYGRTLSPSRVDRIVAVPQSSNPLYLSVLLDELRFVPSNDELEKRINDYLQAEDVPQLFERVLLRYEEDYEEARPELVGDALTSVWASRRGLLERELLEILGSVKNPLPRSYWSPLSIAMGSSLVYRSGLIGFSHDYLRQAVYHRFIASTDAARAAHLRIADYFGNRQYGIARTMDELPWQLVESHEWNRLARVLSRPKILAAAFALSRSEPKRYWRLIEKNTDLKMPDIFRAVIEAPNRFGEEALVISDLLDETSYPDEAAVLLGKLLRTYQLRNDLPGESACLSRIGLLDLAMGNYAQARAAFQRCEKIGEQLGNTGLMQSALHNQSLVQENEGALQDALRMLDRAIALGQNSADKHGQCLCLKQKAKILRKLGQVVEADELLNRVYLLALQVSDDDLVGQVLRDRAALCYQMGRLAESEELNRRIAATKREMGDLKGVASTLNHLGLVRKSEGRLQEALSHQEEAAAIFRKLGLKEPLASALGNQAETLIRMRRLEDAEKLNDESIAIYQDLGIIDELSVSVLNKAIILLVRDRLDEATAVVQDAKRLGRTSQRPDLVARALTIQADIGERRGDYTGAERLLTQAIDAFSKGDCLEGLAAAYPQRGALLCKHLERTEEALDDFEKSIEIAEGAGFRQIALKSLSLMIEVFRDINDYELALAAARELTEKARAYGDHREHLRASVVCCDLLYRLGKHEEAQSTAEQTVSKAENAGTEDLYAMGLFTLGVILRERGHTQQCLLCLEKALACCQRVHAVNLSIRCMVTKAQVVAFDLQRREEGLAILHKAADRCDECRLTDEKSWVDGIVKSLEQRAY